MRMRILGMVLICIGVFGCTTALLTFREGYQPMIITSAFIYFIGWALWILDVFYVVEVKVKKQKFWRE